MKITVTKEDIGGGRRSDPEDCPVARALRRAGVVHFGVTGMAVMIPGERQHTSVLLPGEVQEWIMDFDWGTPVKPIEFELALPQEQMQGRARKAIKGAVRMLKPVSAVEPEPMLLPRMRLDDLDSEATETEDETEFARN